MTGPPGPPHRLLGPVEIRALARRLDLRPTKSRGQNFLHDANTVRRIVRTADLQHDDVVLEVGPGLGSLTLGLLPHCSRVVAVEVDGVLAAALPRTVEELAPGLRHRLLVVEADALSLDAAHVSGPAPTAMVANLPYNIAVPVLLQMLAEFPSLRQVLVMVQAEVAQRLAAAPGSRIYGIPSVKAAWYGVVRRAGVISRHVFWPEPNVDSELVSLHRRPVPEGAHRAAVFAVVDAAFATRRKTLRAALTGWAGSAQRAEELLRAAGIDPSLRGEAMDLQAFVALAGAAGRMEA